MVAPLVAQVKSKVAGSSTNQLAPARSTFPAESFGGSALEQPDVLQRSIRNQPLRLLAQRAGSLLGNEHNDQHQQEVDGIAREALVASVNWYPHGFL
jgi:hypothetical protein